MQVVFIDLGTSEVSSSEVKKAAEVRQLERIFTERMRRTQESVVGGCAKRR